MTNEHVWNKNFLGVRCVRCGVPESEAGASCEGPVPFVCGEKEDPAIFGSRMCFLTRGHDGPHSSGRGPGHHRWDRELEHFVSLEDFEEMAGEFENIIAYEELAPGLQGAYHDAYLRAYGITPWMQMNEFFGVTTGRYECEKHGHDWVDESVAGPDSGNMAGTCLRCGESFCTWLY